MNKQLNKTYDPKQFEDRIYQNWESENYFHAEADDKKTPYTIVIPPPNITGQLHMGHALDCTLQDIIIRWRRMQGYSALWLPGTDHASIATEAKIVEQMKSEGVSKEQLGRDGFLERAWIWKEKYGGTIINQLKKLGASCDWERERFTLDDGCNKAVNEVFIKLYEKGLIYRGERIINWCPNCLTSISDAEVEFEQKQGNFWHIKYPLTDGSGFIEIATTRPETMLGDTAVAVAPDDERYSHLIGKMLKLPLTDREIPIIADSYVEKDFGTGCVKITPAHDPNDFEVGLRHNLEIITIMDDKAIINKNGGKYEGMERYVARKAIIADLDKMGLLVHTKEHIHNVGECYRCSTVVEPKVSKQWFVKMEPLAKPAIEAVENNEIKFVPQRFEKTYFHWMNNIKDWCISRQLWWGHRIPAYYCDDCGHTTVCVGVKKCEKCQSEKITQDPDTLDTWFSSALWPFSTLGWPEKTKDLDYFFPTNTLVTGYDIIFFWVARMIFSSIENTGKIPFDTVFIHGIVRDSEGKKMSKSLGNGIDPLEIIGQYGADALRFMLASGTSPGNDMRYMEQKINASRNFANKLWNAARFILMNIDEKFEITQLPKNLKIEDEWFLSKYNNLVNEVNQNLEKFDIGVAATKLYDFIWDIMCDWYIELVKTRLSQNNEDSMAASQVLIYVMKNTLKLLHPFMPFITEEIFSAMPGKEQSIMISEFPKFEQQLNFESSEEKFEKIMDAIRGIRNARAQSNVPNSKKANIFIQTNEIELFINSKDYFKRLVSGEEIEVEKDIEIEDALIVATDCAKIFIPLNQLIDKEKELQRLNNEKSACEKDIAELEKKVNNQNFMQKAPANVVEEIKHKYQKANEKLENINQSISKL